MIGQEKLQNQIIQQINNNTFPRFSIIVGLKGSGKKTLIRTLSKHFNANIVMLEDVKIDTIRSMITTSYKVASKTVYVIPDADSMSIAAKNAILKITEEPPYNAYFIMTLVDESQMLPTIKSRGAIYRMYNYLPREVYDYAKAEYGYLDANTIELIVDIAETPLEVNQLVSYGVKAFDDYVRLVVSNIAEVSGANSFKIADKLNVGKESDDKFDLKLFWKTFMKICLQEFRYTKDLKYKDAIDITTKALQELNINGINRQMLFDTWLLDVRESWM